MLLGMIASGKETQANVLKRRYPLKFVESGVYTRNLLKKKGKVGDWARRTAGKGGPLPTALLQEFLEKETGKKPKGKDLLLLGTPRLKPEAQLLKKIMAKRKEDFFALYITLPDKEVYRRSLKRKEGDMHEIYKVFDEKKLIARRIKWHKDQVSKSIKYFEGLGKLKKINGNQPIPKVTKDIVKAIEGYKKSNLP